MGQSKLESESRALAVRQENPIIPATEYVNKRGYMPETVAYRSKGLPLKNVEDGSKEHTQLLKIMDELPSYMGVRDALTTEQIVVTTAFIKDEFGHLNTAEVVRAFKMVAAGKLYATIEASQEGASSAQLRAVSDGQLVRVTGQTFNQWSLPYVGKVLNAYSEMRQRETHEWSVKTEVERTRLSMSKESRITPQEALAYIVDKIESSGEIPFICDWSAAFEQLEHLGEIDMTIEEKLAYMDAVRDTEREKFVGMPSRFAREKMKKFEDGLPSECRRRIVMTWAIHKYPKATVLRTDKLPKVKLK